ncbi:MAG: response regulator [Acidobacteriota bacterium]|nr:response regulator [Acidobacteriota bacterium]
MTKILVVDDEPFIVTGIQMLLELHDIESVGASTRETAEAHIADEFFPVILSDLRMQNDDDGFHLLDAVRRLSPRSRVATMTAHADDATVARLREHGAALVLHKPLVDDELVAALREMLQTVEEAEAAHVDDDALYTATLPTLQAIARGRFGFTTEDAEELVQETWLLFLEKRQAVRAPRPWLSGTIANLCRQEIGRRVRSRDRDTEVVEAAFTPADETVLALHQALAKLDDRSRTLCTVLGLEQRSYEEASELAQLPIGSIGPLYQRAKARLRRELEA